MSFHNISGALVIFLIVFAAKPVNADETYTRPDHNIIFLPGIGASADWLLIRGKEGRANMVSRKQDRIQPYFEVQGPDFYFHENFGFTTALSFRTYSLQYSENRSTFSYGDKSSDASVSYRKTGADVQGSSLALHAVLFYDPNPDSTSFRFGFGAGPGLVRLKGSADMISGLSALPVLNYTDKAGFVHDLQLTALIAGNGAFRTDPVYGFLLANAAAPGGLELLGLYSLVNGQLQPDLVSLYYLNYLGARQASGADPLTLAESLAALTVTRNRFDYRRTAAFDLKLFAEYEMELFRLRTSFGGPVFQEEGFLFNLESFTISVMIPVRF